MSLIGAFKDRRQCEAEAAILVSLQDEESLLCNTRVCVRVCVRVFCSPAVKI